MDDHQRRLQQRVHAAAVARHVEQERRERVVVDRQQEQEEQLDDRDDGDDVRDQLAVGLAIDADGDGAGDREQGDPEEDRAVEAAPERGQLVEQRLTHVRVHHHVADREVVDHERVHDDGGGERQERRDGVEGADAAFDEPGGAAARADDGDRRGVGGDDERREEHERAEAGHRAGLRSGAEGRAE